MNKYASLFIITCAVLFSLSCSKTHTALNNTGSAGGSSNSAFYVLSDNFTFTFYLYGIGFTSYTDSLSVPGPITVLAPENTGFQSQNWQIYSDGYISTNWAPAYLQDFYRYSVMKGRWSMDSLPLGDNQVLPASQGFSVYVSKYLQGGDTVTTINGSVLAGADINATNGLIQALSQPINPEENHTLTDRIFNDGNLSMFAVALQRVHADTILKQKGPYTVLVPTNSAFVGAAYLSIGLSTMDSLLTVDTAILGPVVRNHIIPGMYFLNDFQRRYTNSIDTLKLPTLAGEYAYLFMGPNPVTPWDPPTQLFLGGSYQGNAAAINSPETPFYGDIPAGNGVVQEISSVLKP